jgi:hypothetical protein
MATSRQPSAPVPKFTSSATPRNLFLPLVAALKLSTTKYQPVKYVATHHIPHWLSDTGTDIRHGVVKLVAYETSKALWAKRSKVTAFF